MENKKFNLGQLLVALLAGLFLGVWAGVQLTSFGYNLSAIKAGVGEYKIVDPANGTTEFVWITNSVPAK